MFEDETIIHKQVLSLVRFLNGGLQYEVAIDLPLDHLLELYNNAIIISKEEESQIKK